MRALMVACLLLSALGCPQVLDVGDQEERRRGEGGGEGESGEGEGEGEGEQALQRYLRALADCLPGGPGVRIVDDSRHGTTGGPGIEACIDAMESFCDLWPCFVAEAFVGTRRRGEGCYSGAESCAQGLVCSADVDQCGVCVEGCSELPNTCAAGEVCEAGACVAAGEVGDLCRTALSCRLGLSCLEGVCVAPPGPNEACVDVCTHGSLCIDGRCEAIEVGLAVGDACDRNCGVTAGLYCDDGACAPRTVAAQGERCELGLNASATCAGVCFDSDRDGVGVCLSQPSRLGEVCSSTLGCTDGAWCDDESERCRALGEEGDACDADEACFGFCGATACEEDAPDGGSCSFTAECSATSSCIDDVCVQKPRTGEPCTDECLDNDDECFGNVCTPQDEVACGL